MPTRAASGEPVVLTSYGEASRAVCRHVWLPQPPLPLALLCGTAAAAAALIPAPHTFLCAGTEGDEARGIAQRIQARLGVAAVEQDGRPANKCFWRACSCCYMPPTARWPRLPPPVLLCWFTRAHAAPPPPPPPPPSGAARGGGHAVPPDGCVVPCLQLGRAQSLHTAGGGGCSAVLPFPAVPGGTPQLWTLVAWPGD